MENVGSRDSKILGYGSEWKKFCTKASFSTANVGNGKRW